MKIFLSGKNSCVQKKQKVMKDWHVFILRFDKNTSTTARRTGRQEFKKSSELRK